MEHTVVDLLHLARTQLRQQLDLDGCPHNGWIDPSDKRCSDCESAHQCRWLEACEDVTTRRDQALAAFSDTLEHGMRYVQNLMNDWGHNSFQCGCDACEWVRTARQVCREYEALVAKPTATGERSSRDAAHLAHFRPPSSSR